MNDWAQYKQMELRQPSMTLPSSDWRSAKTHRRKNRRVVAKAGVPRFALHHIQPVKLSCAIRERGLVRQTSLGPAETSFDVNRRIARDTSLSP